MDKIYHNLFENESGLWCVEYTLISTGERVTQCFETNNEASEFYMS